MKRIVKIALVVFVLIITFSVFCSAERFVTVKLDGEILEFDVQAQIINGRTMVPLRKIFELMGAEVRWDKETYTAIGVKGTRSVEAQINNTSFYVNGVEKIFDTPAMLIDGRTLVPLRFVAEAYGAVVGWDDATSTATITSPEKIKLEEIVNVPYRYDLSEYITLPRDSYIGLEYETYERVASDADVNEQVERILEGYTEYVETDTPCKKGDKVNIDYVGYINGEPFENGADSKYEFVLGSGGFIDGFESGIVGHAAKEDFEIEVVFPEDYGYEDFQGVEATFKIYINSVKKAHRPLFDDEFVAKTTEFDTADMFLEYIGKLISNQLTENARNDVANTLFAEILEKAEINNLPEEEYNKKVGLRIEAYEATASQYGMTLDEFIKMYGMTQEDFKGTVEKEVTEAFLTELAVYTIANTEDIISKINKADYIEVVDEIALSNSATYEDVIRYVDSDTIVTYVVLEAVIDFIFDNGIVVTTQNQ